MLKNSDNLDPEVKKELLKKLIQNPKLLPPEERHKLLKQVVFNLKDLDRYF